MQELFKILHLKKEIHLLKNKREDMVLRLNNNFERDFNKMEKIESILPGFFEKIDKKIKSRERLLNILKNKKVCYL